MIPAYGEVWLHDEVFDAVVKAAAASLPARAERKSWDLEVEAGWADAEAWPATVAIEVATRRIGRSARNDLQAKIRRDRADAVYVVLFERRVLVAVVPSQRTEGRHFDWIGIYVRELDDGDRAYARALLSTRSRSDDRSG